MADKSRQMNVVFFMQDTGSVYGAERATLDLAGGLRDAGENVRFFLMREARLTAPSAFLAAIEAAGFAAVLFPVSGRFSAGLARSVKRAFKAAGGDVLHVLGYKAHVHAWLAGIRPRVSTVHGWLFRQDAKERLYGWLEMLCLRVCDRVICLSSYYEDYLLKRGVRRERLICIPSGLRNVPSASPLPVHAGGPVTFGMMGRFSEEKNHAMFLRAVASIREDYPQTRFVIAGAGPLEAALRSSGEGVSFPGYLPVDEFFQAVDVYVICSRIENLPYSILEAMAHGRPVIGTRVGGIPDLVEDQSTGLLVAPDDAIALADAMRHFIQHPERIDAYGAAGRKKLLNDFDAQRCVEAHQALYRGL